LQVCGGLDLDNAIYRQIEGTPDEELLSNCYDRGEFVAKFGKPEPAANDAEASAAAMKARFAAEEAASS